MKKDKARDVARSVLPSKRRRTAREDKRQFHQANRRNQNQINHDILRSTTVCEDGEIRTDPELFDDYGPRHVIDGYSARTKKDGATYEFDIGYIVRERRDRDKLGPLLSWARATERHKMVGWSVHDKLAYFKAILPDTLQGRHALSHIETALDLLTDDTYGRRYRRWNREPPKTKEQFTVAVEAILSRPKDERRLHDFIRETVPVAAHATETNNKKRTREVARDENGEIRYSNAGATVFPARENPYRAKYPLYVDVYVPQVVAVTCDDCSFIRNDPLGTPEAVKRFIDLLWEGRFKFLRYGRGLRTLNPHPFFGDITDFIFDQSKA